jgi:N-acetylglucosamine kinase-like BadF-type ATPase
MSNEKSILIADSGSTKTAWKYLYGNEHFAIETPGINPYYQSGQQIRDSLLSNVSFIQLIPRQVSAVYFYGAGCSSEANKQTVLQAIKPIFPNAKLEIDHDLLGAARALCGREAGIACILGTGSNSCLFDGRQIAGEFTNLGFWLGDEGSGGYLGKQLVKAWFHKEMPEELWQIFNETYRLNRDEFLETVYKKPYPNRYMAGFSIFLHQHLNHYWCKALVADAFVLFLKRYVSGYPHAKQLPVHFLGSIAIHYQELLIQTVEKAGFEPGKMLGSAIDGLSLYHQL